MSDCVMLWLMIPLLSVRPGDEIPYIATAMLYVILVKFLLFQFCIVDGQEEEAKIEEGINMTPQASNTSSLSLLISLFFYTKLTAYVVALLELAD
jgi:hypothetical protein